MTKTLNPKVQKRLEAQRHDYEQVTGRAFRHFACPILAIDQPAELIQGHVINQAFEGAPRNWDVQRADVDNFFGAFFEAGFDVSEPIGPSPLQFGFQGERP